MSENVERNEEIVETQPGEATSVPEAADRLSREVNEAAARAEVDEADAEALVEEYQSKYYGARDDGKAEKDAGAEKVKRAEEVRKETARVIPPAPPLPPKPPKPERRALAAPSGTDTLTAEDERLWAALAHASVPLTLVLGIFSGLILVPLLIFIPVVIYFAYRDRSRIVAYHALQAFAMQLLMTFGWACVGLVSALVLGLAIAVSGVLSIVLIGIPFLIAFVVLAVVVAIVWIVAPFAMALYSLWAAVETYSGRDFRYKWIAEWVDRYI